MKIGPRLNTLYAALAFAVTFVFYIPVIILFAQKLSWHKAGLNLHRWWTLTLLRMFLLPVRISWKYKPGKKDRFVICSNHFSYLDIPSLTILPFPFKFIGKSSIAKIPIFGYMYRKLHITVNRSSFKSRAESMKNARKMADLGFNIAFFPEGGIKSSKPPKMVKFQDGAFRLAVEKSLPILPVTLPTNYQILPDDGRFLVYRKTLEIIVHRPIYPQSEGEDEILRLKEATYHVIQQELNKQRGID